LEAIKHATDAKVPVIVAINKVDKPGGDVDRVKQDLARHGVTVEDFGGEVQAIPVSGKMGTGMAELEEATLTLSELLDHRAERDGPVEGWIIESKVTMAGRVATVLVRRGTLRRGDIIVAGTAWARIRTLRNDGGILVDEALPGTPVQVDGWHADDPIAGWEILQANDENHAKTVLELRHEREELIRLADDSVAINATRAEQAEERQKVLLDWEAEKQTLTRPRKHRYHENAGWVEGKRSAGPKQVHFVVKADVSGSVEAVVNLVSAIGNNDVVANVIRSGVGSVSESDIQFLASSGEVGYLISFNQAVDGQMYDLAEEAGVGILDHNIIYKVTDVVKEKLTAELPPTVAQRVVGEAEIGEVFEITVKKSKLKVAGCKIGNGIISRDKKVRVLEAGKVVFDGKSLATSPSVLLFLLLLLLLHSFCWQDPLYYDRG
jgi:translation initiation factor IF-2